MNFENDERMYSSCTLSFFKECKKDMLYLVWVLTPRDNVYNATQGRLKYAKLSLSMLADLNCFSVFEEVKFRVRNSGRNLKNGRVIFHRPLYLIYINELQPLNKITLALPFGLGSIPPSLACIQHNEKFYYFKSLIKT